MLGPRRREDLQVHPGFREKLGILPGLVPPHYASQRPADIPADQELRVKDLRMLQPCRITSMVTESTRKGRSSVTI